MSENKAFGRLLNAFQVVAAGIGLLVAIPSVVSSFTPQLRYCVLPIRTMLVAPNRSPALEVLYNDKKIVEGIGIAAIGVWNAGRDAIDRDDIQSFCEACDRDNVIRILLPGKGRILDVDTVDVDRGTGLQYWAAGNEVDLSWKLLRGKQGFKVQIVYEGDGAQAFDVVGDIDRQPALVRFEASNEIRSAERQLADYQRARASSPWLVLCAGAMFVVLAGVREVKTKGRANKRALAVAVSLGLVLLLLGLYLSWWLRASAPPFKL